MPSKPATAPAKRTCPSCFLGDDASRDTCINKGVLGCPPPISLTDDRAVEVKCGPCGKHLVIPIGSIMQRKRLTELGSCSRDRCAAKIILPNQPARPAVPPPLTEAPAGDGGN